MSSVAFEVLSRIQDMDDGPGELTQAHTGLFLQWDNDRRCFVMAQAAEGEQRIIVGNRRAYGYIQRLQDGPGALGAADDGKVLTWDAASKKFVATTPSAGVTDHALLSNLDYASSGHTGFEVSGAAAWAVAAHVALGDPHTQYLFDSAVSAYGLTLIDDANAGAARTTLGLGTIATEAETNYLLATGTRTGATSQAQTFTNGVITGKVYPSSNSTNAFGLYRANGTTQDYAYDSTNGRHGFGPDALTPTELLHIGRAQAGITRILLYNNNGNGYAEARLRSDVVDSRFGVSGTNVAPAGYFNVASNHDFYFATNNTNRLSLSKSGGLSLGATYYSNSTASGVMIIETKLGIGTTSPGTILDAADTNAGTSAIQNALTLRSTNAGTPAAGFGVGFRAGLKSSTTTDQDAGRLTWEWSTATHASRASKGKLSAYYTSTERECIAWEANSTVPLVGFYGVAPVARPAAYTQTYNTAARTVNAYTTDAEAAYTGQDNAQAGSVYAKYADLEALRVAYTNLEAGFLNVLQVLTSVIDDHQAIGILQ